MWEQEHGTEFQVNGQQFLEYVKQQWDQHHNEKEKEKLERVSDVTDFTEIFPLDECVNEHFVFICLKQQMKKTKQTQEEMLYGTAKQTPSKRRLVGTPTPAKIRKVGVDSAAVTTVPSMYFTFVFFCSVPHHLSAHYSK